MRDCCSPRTQERGGGRLRAADAWPSSGAGVSGLNTDTLAITRDSGSDHVVRSSLPPRCSRPRRSLRHVAVHGPELRRPRRARDADGLEGRLEALDEPLRVRVRLEHLDHSPAAVRTRTGDVEDPPGGPLQAEPLPNPLVDLLRAVRVVDHHCDRHPVLLLLFALDAFRRAEEDARTEAPRAQSGVLLM